GGNVHCHESMGSPWGVDVKKSSKNFLSRSGLSENGERGIARRKARGRLQEPPHRRAARNEVGSTGEARGERDHSAHTAGHFLLLHAFQYGTPNGTCREEAVASSRGRATWMSPAVGSIPATK